MSINLSKSAYMQGLRCPVTLWYQWYKKNIKPDFNHAAQGGFRQGNEIGALARDYFDDGVTVSAPALDRKACIAETEKLIDDGEELIFEATAQNPADGTYAHIDALRKVPGTDEWDLIEVKSSTKVKPEHIDDLAFQYHVFTGAGYKIRNCYLMHVNFFYERKGKVDVKKLFKMKDITAEVLQKQSEVPGNISKITAVLSDKQNPPSEDHELLCRDPYSCSYKQVGHGWPLHSIFNVFASKDFADNYAKMGSARIEDIPDELLPANVKAIDVECYKTGKEHVDQEKLHEFLDKLEYPLYYLDYETMMKAVPPFDGTHPYQQVTFQFSLHIQEEEDGPLEHHEFIHQDRSDPRRAFAEALIDACGEEGSVIVYNKAFESKRNEELAEAFPELADQLLAINSRMVDLYEPFRHRWLYHPEQNGSASIKAVLPAFTDLSYDELEIGKGTQAMDAYARFMDGDKKIKPDELWPALLAYCEMDTYAMVELLNVVREKADTPPPPKPSGPEDKPLPF